MLYNQTEYYQLVKLQHRWHSISQKEEEELQRLVQTHASIQLADILWNPGRFLESEGRE